MRKMNKGLGTFFVSIALVMGSMTAYAEEVVVTNDAIVATENVVTENETTGENVENTQELVLTTDGELVAENLNLESAVVEVDQVNGEDITLNEDELLGAAPTEVIDGNYTFISTPISKEIKFDKHYTIKGDCTVDSPIFLDGYTLTVYGNLYANTTVKVGTNGKLIVKGNYYQIHESLHPGTNGTVSIDGSLIVAGRDRDDNIVVGDGGIWAYQQENMTYNIGKDFIFNSSNALWNKVFWGTMNLKGDYICYQNRGFNGILNLISSPEHKIVLEDEAWLGDISTNSKIIADNINGKLISNATITATKPRVTVTKTFDGNGKKITFEKSVDAKSTVKIGTNGVLTVKGDYVQVAESLHPGNGGTLNVDGNLAVYGYDNDGNIVCGDGGIWTYQQENMTYNVGKDFIFNSSNTLWNKVFWGTMNLKGDYTCHQNRGFNGTLNLISNPEHKIVLDDGAWLGDISTNSKITADNINGKFICDAIITSAKPKIIVTNSLEVNGNKITFEKSVDAKSTVKIGTNGVLTVKGDYVQIAESLHPGNGGTLNVDGNLAVYGYDSDGNIARGNGGIWAYQQENMTYNVGKDFIFNSSNALWNKKFWGTMNLKGNYTCYDDISFSGTMNFIGDKAQNVTLAKGSYFGVTKQSSPMLNWDGIFEASLGSNINITPVGNGVSLNNVKMKEYNLTINGNAKGVGNVSDFTTKSTLTVKGEYNQTAGTLNVGVGNVVIEKNFLARGLDSNNNYVAGSGSLCMNSASGQMTVNGGIYIQSTKNTELDAGILTVYGDIHQFIESGATGYISSKVDHKTILPGKQKQVVSLENSKSQFGTLVLQSKDSQYAFNPNNCWIKLVHESENTKKFSDVRDNDWFKAAVDYAVQNGIMTGMGNDTFNPNGKCTREQMLQILFSAEGKVAVTVNNPFTDVKAGSWYYNAVLWGYSKGITGGLSATRFGVGQPVTREQMALFLMTYAKTKNFDTTARANISTFADAAKVSSWAREAISWANASKIISGKGGNRLDPTGTATRAEVAQMIMSFQKTFGK